MEQIVIAILGSGVLSTLISVVSNIIRERRKKNSGISLGLQQVLFSLIKEGAKKHIGNGEISAEDLEDILRMHKVYHDELNGNGYLDELINQVKKLKVTV